MSSMLYAFASDVSGFTHFPWLMNRYPDAGMPESKAQFTPQMGGGAVYVGPLRGLPETPYTVSMTGRFIEASPQALHDAILSIRRACYSVGRLYRRSIIGTTSWVRAYFKSAPMEMSHDIIFPFAGQWCMDVTLTFEIYDPVWKARYHGKSFAEGDRYDDGYVENGVDTWTLDTTPKTVAFSIGGDRDVRDIDLIVAAGSTALTGLTVENRTIGTKLVYTGPVPVTRQVLISTERQSVEHITSLNTALVPGATQIVCDTTYAVAGGAVSVLLDNGHVWATSVASIGSGLVNVPQPGAPSVARLTARVGFGAFYSNVGVRQITWTQDQWVRFDPGTNDLLLTRVGGSTATTVTPLFHEVES